MAASDARAQELLRCGVPAPRFLDAGEIAEFRIETTPGTQVVIDATETAPSIGLLRMRVSDGDNRYETCTGSLTFRATQAEVRVELADCLGSESGAFTIAATVTSSTADSCAKPLPCGSSLEGVELRVRGEVDAYSFIGVMGRRVLIALDDVAGTIGRVRTRLFDSAGVAIPQADSCAGTLQFDPPSTGTYTLLVSPCGVPNSGPYRITFRDAECPTGPDLTYIGVAGADGVPLAPVLVDADNRQHYAVAGGSGFILVIEARPGSGARPVATEAYVQSSDRLALPDLQLLLSQPLGDGSAAVCDKPGGGVPAVVPLEFAASASVADAINDLGCRFNDGRGRARGIVDSAQACTRLANGGYGFVDSTSSVQFCLPVASDWPLPIGDTTVAVRARDTGMVLGPRREMVVRVGDVGPAFLLGDIAPGRNSTDDAATPKGLTTVGDVLFFTADDGTTGVELWRSDATMAGTRVVRDLRPGLDGSFPENLKNVRGNLFFTANDGGRGRELWRSDGTASGTIIVRDISPGQRSTTFASAVAVGRLLFFVIDDPGTGRELWRSDGTGLGTFALTDINPGTASSDPYGLAAVGELLYFRADDGVHGGELWCSDGTLSGTFMVADITPGRPGSEPTDLTESGGVLFFSADDGVHGRELWRSDGSAAGTYLVKDIYAFSTSPSDPTSLVDLLGKLIFVARTPSFGAELWSSDGTELGTQIVKNIRLRSLGSFPSGLTVVGNEVFFFADDGIVGAELWKSDGSGVGTKLVRDIVTGKAGLASTYPFVGVGRTLVFAVADANGDFEPWQSDGSEAGTFRIQDIAPGSSPSLTHFPSAFAATTSHLFFRADDGVTGAEVWALPLAVPCPGDCNADRSVDIAESIRSVAIFTGETPMSSCPAADTNRDRSVSIGEVTRAISAALHGCGGS